MKRLQILFILVIFFASFDMLFAKNKAILKLDTLGHTAKISDIIVTDSGELISASNDKTIRVWDINTGKEKRKILGQIGNGSQGMIFSIALSPDKKYLAVGGYILGSGNDGSRAGPIRIYNYYTGKLLQILKSHTNVVLDLAFSKDGRYLISGSGDKTVKIWDVQNGFRLKDTIYFHKNDVYAVKIIKKANKYFVITAGFDNQIAIYDMQNKQILNSHRLDYKLIFLAINYIKKHIAVCGTGKEIKIYDYNLNLIKTIYSDTVPTGLSYSKDGKYLIAGAGDYPLNVNIYKTPNYTLFSSFKKHNNLTMAVGFFKDGKKIYGVSGGGNNNVIYVWDIKTLKIKTKIEGVGQIVLSVGIDGDNIAWGNKLSRQSQNDRGPLQKFINLKTFKIQNLNTHSFNRITTINGAYSLTHTKGGDYGYSDAVLLIQKNNQTVAKIVKKSYNGFRHRCYGWYKDYIISGGNDGALRVYDKKGKEVASLIGHTGEVWSIALDGDTLVSGSADQTIKVWDLSKISNKEVSLVKPSWFNKASKDWINKNYPNYQIHTQNDVKRLYNKLLENRDTINAKKLEVSQKIYPMLNIFVSKDNEYIIWSKSGYFTSSVGGAKYIGYYINKGSDKEARFVDSDKYFDTLYRPDIISYIWQTGSEKKAIAFANRKKRVKTVDVSSSLPPIVYLLSSSNIKTTKDSITIKYQVKSDSPIVKTVITVNGKMLSKRALKLNKQKDYEVVEIPLEDGENYISIKAKNRFAFSDEVIVSAYKTSKTKTIYKPTLYLLSIGVSRYKNSEFNLEFADKDAKAIAKLFKAQEGKVYKKVVTKVLTNEKAITDNILDMLDWIDKETTSKDVVIIFIAGHGINDEKGNYYFLSHEANLERLRRTALKWIEIEDTVSNLPSKVILLADTCHSGNITGSRRDTTSAIKSIIDSGSGAVIMSATTGRGYSYEQSDWGHGAFTLSFIEGLQEAKADYNDDKMITIKEIDLYITNRVKKLTGGKQKPTTVIPNSVPDFAIGVK